jgi:arsenate reductase
MITIFHNPKCRKSREGLNYLKSKTDSFFIREYLKDFLSADELEEILLKSNLKPIALIRKQEEIFKKELKGRQFTDEEWKRIILEYPKLLQRPIVIGRYKAVIAQPAERIDEVLKKI